MKEWCEKKSRFRPNTNSRCYFWEYSRHEKISSLGKQKNQQTFLMNYNSRLIAVIVQISQIQVKLRLVQSGFMPLWQASRQRRINNIDLRINHIVQDSEGIPKHVINHPNATRHCVDWLFIWKDSHRRISRGLESIFFLFQDLNQLNICLNVRKLCY